MALSVRLLLALVVVGCSPGELGAGGGGDDDSGAVDGTQDGADGSDSGDGDSGDTTTVVPQCADGMAPVPANDPIFCIDIYEGSDAGTGVATVAGAEPLVGESFDAGRDRCAATPVVDAAGEVVGTKRLATLAEWRDAADGQVGPGGLLYPTGSEWPGDACAVPNADGTAVLDGLQPTGSLPDCVSPFGVYDQLGNAWEWADPQLDISFDEFLAAQSSRGASLELGADGLLSLASGTTSGLSLEIPGLRGTVGDVDGTVVATAVHFQATEPFEYRGYLLWAAGESEDAADWLLPVQVLRVDGVEDADVAELVVLIDEDGEAVTAKVGCAWYTGGDTGCRTSDRFLFHPHDFGGTIAPRCASEPLP